MPNYFGIDLGDGETSATCLFGNNIEKSSFDPANVPLRNKDSIISVVGTRAGLPVVGDEAIIGGQAVSDVRSRFKSKYLSDREESKKSISRFAQGIYNLLKGQLELDDYELALGCPAGWSESERIEYAQLATAAGFKNLRPVSESRAAFLFAHYNAGLSQEGLKRSTLVIDFGSSTIDFAYIVDGKQNNVGVFGDTIGGGLLDRCIYDNAVEECRGLYPDVEKFNDSVYNPTWRNLGELRARAHKEKYFDLNSDGEFSFKYAIYKYADSPVMLDFILSAERVNNILDTPLVELDGRTFRQGLYDSLNKAKSKTAENPPEILLLTGGASKMKFFKDMCKEVFPNAYVMTDKEPAFSISKGLAIAAYIDSRLRGFRDKISDYLNDGKITAALSSNIAPLMTKLRPVLQTIILDDCVVPSLNGLGPLATADDIENAIIERSEIVFNDPEKLCEVNAIIREWIPGTLIGIQKDFDNLCDSYKVDKVNLSLSNITGDLIKIDSLNVSGVFVFACRIIAIGFGFKTLDNLAKGMLRKKVNAAIDDAIGINGRFAQRLANDLSVEISNKISENVSKIEMLI